MRPAGKQTTPDEIKRCNDFLKAELNKLKSAKRVRRAGARRA